jgi:peptide deformylase
MSCSNDSKNEDQLRPILQLGDSRLKMVSEPVREHDILYSLELQKEVEDLNAVLHDFQLKNGFGRAIAAPQLGIHKRFIALRLNSSEPGIALFNPMITFKSEEMFSIWDDCFSFPDIMVHLKRHKSISISYLNDKAEVKTLENCSLSLSELLQHEIDHLDGILAVDRVEILDNNVSTSIISRKAWLSNRAYYESLLL